VWLAGAAATWLAHLHLDSWGRTCACARVYLAMGPRVHALGVDAAQEGRSLSDTSAPGPEVHNEGDAEEADGPDDRHNIKLAVIHGIRYCKPEEHQARNRHHERRHRNLWFASTDAGEELSAALHNVTIASQLGTALTARQRITKIDSAAPASSLAAIATNADSDGSFVHETVHLIPSDWPFCG
jgi:hypothetical protein